MEFEDLTKLIFGEIKPKLENNQGLSIFAKERAKFEVWLKVELCDCLSKYSKDIAPERNRIDKVIILNRRQNLEGYSWNY